MRRSVVLVVSLLWVLFVSMPLGVYAADNGVTFNVDSQGNGDPIIEVDKIITDGTDLQKRLDSYKKAYVAQLTEAAKTRLSQRCEAAQTKIGTLGSSTEKVVEARMRVYNAMLERLGGILDKLDAASDNARDLKSIISSLKIKIDEFQSKLTTYRQSLVDVKAIKCKDDPAGFKSSLLAARQAQADALTAAKSIRTFVTESVKPMIASLIKQFDTQSSTNSEGQ